MKKPCFFSPCATNGLPTGSGTILVRRIGFHRRSIDARCKTVVYDADRTGCNRRPVFYYFSITPFRAVLFSSKTVQNNSPTVWDSEPNRDRHIIGRSQCRTCVFTLPLSLFRFSTESNVYPVSRRQ